MLVSAFLKHCDQQLISKARGFLYCLLPAARSVTATAAAAAAVGPGAARTVRAAATAAMGPRAVLGPEEHGLAEGVWGTSNIIRDQL